jgi:transposase
MDCGDWTLDYQMRNDSDQVLAEGQVPPTVEGLAALYLALEAHGTAGEIGILMETPHGVWIQPLLDRGYRVYPVNPKSAEHFRRALYSQGDKSDRIDRRVLSLMLKHLHSRLRPLKPDDPEIISLRIACQDRLRLVQERTAKVNELQAILKGHYPAVLGLFGSLDSDIALDFLEAFPTQKLMRDLSEKRLRTWLRRHQYTRSQRIDAMIARLAEPVLPIAEHLQEAKRPLIRFLARSLRALNAEIRERDDQMQRTFAALPESDWVGSLPGAGNVLGPALLACVGRDPHRFAHVGQARALMGTAPVTVQSGARKTVRFRWGCWKFARRTLQLFAAMSLRDCPWARDFYQGQRDKGHRHHSALRALAHKWLKIILALQRTARPYDERLFLNHRCQHLLTSSSRKVLTSCFSQKRLT